jgi:hypothetical protein
MPEVLPLPIYPYKPTGQQLTVFKSAKEKVNTTTLVQLVKAVPGSPGRIIAMGEKPTWLCEYAYIPNPKIDSATIDSLEAAINWALGIKEDARGVTVIRTLREIFGPGVKEV